MMKGGIRWGMVAALWLAFAPYAAATEVYGPGNAKALVSRGIILPLKVVVEKAERLKAGRLLEAELRKKHGRYVYEVEVLDREGVVWEMKFNAATGELLKIEEEDD